MRLRFLVLIAACSLALYACGGGGGSSSSSLPADSDSTDAPVDVTVTADYSDSSFSGDDDSRSYISRPYYTFCLTSSYDIAGVVAGSDCDSDGGVVAYETPSDFSIAIKRLSLVKSDNTKVDLIADTGTLAESEVLDLSNPVTLDVSSIPQGTYTRLYAEFYYYDMTMELYDSAAEKIRLYLSDDDFPSEGSLGNHQGDVKLDDGSGNFGFVPAGDLWITALTDAIRPADIGGAASDDSETGHDRGLYGNDNLWNQDDFMQGADQDIFVVDQSFGAAVTVGSLGGSITISFDLIDTWFYEDFNSNGKFEPCVATQPNEACAAGSEWTPLFPGINFSFAE